MRPPAKPASQLANLLLSSSRTRSVAIAFALIACLGGAPSATLVSTAQSVKQGDVDEPRAKSGAWILDQRTRKGYRVADLTDDNSTDASRSRIAELGESAKYGGQWTSFDPPGYSPAQVRKAYGFDKLKSDGRGQIIGIVSAFDYPNAAADLKKFITTFKLKTMYGLPGRAPCTVAAGPHPCFEVVYARGTQPAFDAGWSVEGALDTQWAHAIAPGADILLVEASSNFFIDLFQAVQVATTLGATVVSMSWGGPEFAAQFIFEPLLDQTGVTFVAASGDSGNSFLYPAASPFVVAVGGTRLPLDKKGNRNGSETAWSESGGGISQYFAEPSYQYTYPIPDTGGYRGNPDVAYNADPATGVSVYNSHLLAGQTGWFSSGGTSAGAPQWAGLIALANQLRRNGNLSSNNVINSPIYDVAKDDYRDNFFDIKSGSNGACGALCTAGRGYDFVTGLGSPRADELVEELAEQRHH